MLNYTDIIVNVDGKNYAATQSNFSVSSSVDAIYSLSGFNAKNNSTSQIKGTLSLDYYIDNDGIVNIFNNITKNQISGSISPVVVSLGEQSFARAYLTSHSASAQPNQLATAKATFDLYFDNISQAISFGNTPSNGTLSTTGLASAVNTEILGSAGGISDVISFSYDSSIQYDFIFKIGQSFPEKAFVSKASKKMTIDGFDINSNIKMCSDGNDVIIEANVLPLCQSSGTKYSVSGYLSSLEGSVSAGQVGRSKAIVNQFI